MPKLYGKLRSGGKTDTRRETGRDSLPLPLSPMVLCREPEQHLVAPTRLIRSIYKSDANPNPILAIMMQLGPGSPTDTLSPKA